MKNYFQSFFSFYLLIAGLAMVLGLVMKKPKIVVSDSGKGTTPELL